MKVLILAPSFYPATKAGGPARSLTNLARIAAQSHEVTVLTSDRDLGDEVPFPLAQRIDSQSTGGANVTYVNLRSVHDVRSAMKLVLRIEWDVVVLNSMWHRTLAILPAVAIVVGRLKARRVVLMTRGELESGALGLKSRRKAVAAPIFRRLYGRAVTHVAATSDSEASNLREWFPNHDCLRVSNSPDVITPGFVDPTSPRLRVLFIGRIHPTKGLLQLLQSVSSSDRAISVTIAGPVGDEAYWVSCQEVIGAMPQHVEVVVLGSVGRAEIPALYWSHDLMCTLTLGENFGHTIAESLQAGCPVLATAATPWTRYLIEGGGFVVPDQRDTAATTAALISAAGMTSEERRALRSQAAAAYRSWQRHQDPDVVTAAVAQLVNGDPPAKSGASSNPRTGRVSGIGVGR